MSREQLARRRVEIKSLVEDGPHKCEEVKEKLRLMLYELELLTSEEWMDSLLSQERMEEQF